MTITEAPTSQIPAAYAEDAIKALAPFHPEQDPRRGLTGAWLKTGDYATLAQLVNRELTDEVPWLLAINIKEGDVYLVLGDGVPLAWKSERWHRSGLCLPPEAENYRQAVQRALIG